MSLICHLWKLMCNLIMMLIGCCKQTITRCSDDKQHHPLCLYTHTHMHTHTPIRHMYTHTSANINDVNAYLCTYKAQI